MYVYIGENILLRRNLQKADNTALLLSETSNISATLIQAKKTVKKWVYGTDNELRQGQSTSQVELELLSTVTSGLAVGEALLKWEIKLPDAAFVVETKQVQIITEQITVVQT